MPKVKIFEKISSHRYGKSKRYFIGMLFVMLLNHIVALFSTRFILSRGFWSWGNTIPSLFFDLEIQKVKIFKIENLLISSKTLRCGGVLHNVFPFYKICDCRISFQVEFI
jgi:hypothetical protein